MIFRAGLRSRLVLLVLVALLPLVGMSIHKAWRDAQSARDSADASLQFTASLAAGNLTHIAESARSLLLAAATAPGLRDVPGPDCGEYFTRLHDRFPAYASFGLVDVQGNVQCRTKPVAGIDYVGDSTYFKDAVQRKAFITSAFLRGPRGGAVIAFAQPVLDAQERPVAVAFATMELAAVLRSVENVPLAPGARLVMLDRNATILAARPAGTGDVGAKVADTVLAAAVARRVPALMEGPGAAGEVRIYAMEPARGAAQGAIFAGVSMDRDSVLMPIRRTLAIELGSLLLVAMLGIALAWTIGRGAIVQPARRIVEAARRLRQGKLDERVPEPVGGEFGRIARAFNVMADSLQQRERDKEAENARAKNAFEVLDLVLNSLQEAMVAADSAGNFLIFNRAAARFFPDGYQGVDPQDWARHFGMYELGSERLLSPEEVPLFRATRGKYGASRDILVRNAVVPQGKVLRCHYRPMVRGSEVVGGLAVFADLTELHELEEARLRDDARLKDLHERLVTAQRIGRIGHWELDLSSHRFWWSEEMYGLLGIDGGFDGTYEEFVGHVHPDDREAFAQLHTGALRAGALESTYRVVTPSGDTRWLQERAELRRGADGRPQVLAGVAQDITARMKAESELRGYMLQLQRAGEAAQAITAQQTLDATLQEVVDRARDVIGAHMAVLSLATGSGWGHNINALSLSDKYAKYRGAVPEPDGSGIYAVVLETGRPLRLTQEALVAHPRWRNHGNYKGKHPLMRGLLAVPLVSGDGSTIGLLQLSDKLEGEFSDHDEYVAMEMARLTSIAIANARLFDEIRELNATLEAKVADRTAELARQEALFRALAEQAPQVVWNIDREGRVTYLNRAWFELVGRDDDAGLGYNWMSALHPEDRDDVAAVWQRASATGLPFSGIRRIRASDGTYHTMAYRGAPVLAPDGSVDFWVGIDADITELKAIEHALRRSNQELEAFSYSVSHDLRAPLSTIDGFSRLLARQIEGEAAEKAHHYLGRIQAAAAQMGQLIEALLSLAQVSRARLRHEAVDITQMAREIVAVLRSRDPARQVETDIGEGVTMPGDPRLVRVMLENLLGNAWKFTSKTPRARIEVGRSGNEVYVRDNGVGFDMVYADKLFAAFQRLHAADDFPGTGIGLATVGRVVARHGGTIRAEAEPGEGAAFYFCLPDSPPPPRPGEGL